MTINKCATLLTLCLITATAAAATDDAPKTKKRTVMSIEIVRGNTSTHMSGGGVSVSGTGSKALGLIYNGNVNDTVSFEAGYMKYGTSHVTIAGEVEILDKHFRFATSALTLGFKSKAALSDNIEIFGRIGIAPWKVIGTKPEGMDDEEFGINAYYGAGVQYNFNKSIYCSLQYNQLATRNNGSSYDLKTKSFNLGYKF